MDSKQTRLTLIYYRLSILIVYQPVMMDGTCIDFKIEKQYPQRKGIVLVCIRVAQVDTEKENVPRAVSWGLFSNSSSVAARAQEQSATARRGNTCSNRSKKAKNIIFFPRLLPAERFEGLDLLQPGHGTQHPALPCDEEHFSARLLELHGPRGHASPRLRVEVGVESHINLPEKKEEKKEEKKKKKEKLFIYSRWTSSLPSCLWSQRIFPSLPGSRLTIFLSRCKFSTLTTRQPMVEFYLLTFPRFPLRKKEHKSYFGKNRTHDFRTSRCAAYLLTNDLQRRK